MELWEVVSMLCGFLIVSLKQRDVWGRIVIDSALEYRCKSIFCDLQSFGVSWKAGHEIVVWIMKMLTSAFCQ